MLATLLRLVSLRHVRTSRLRSLLTVLGIAIGVSVLVAVSGVNGSVLRAFHDMLDAISGKAVITVSAGPAGFPEEVLEKVRAVPGVYKAAPSLGLTLPIAGHPGERLYLFGVDLADDGYFREYKTLDEQGKEAAPDVGDPLEFLNNTDQILLSERQARRLGVGKGDTIRVRSPTGELPLQVRTLLRETGPARAFGGSFAVMDVYAAQIAFGKERTFDRVDVAVVQGHEIGAVRDAIRAAVGPTFTVDRPDRRGGNVEKMLTSFQMGLTLGSMVALIVGLFLVYNTVSIGVVQRRREIGTLRALGLTRRGVVWLFTLEGVVYGVIGTALGIPLGMLLARASLAGVAQTISSLYIVVNPGQGGASLSEVLQAAAAGILSAGFAAWRPASAAASVAPVEALRRDLAVGASERPARWATVIGLALIALAYPVSMLPTPVENMALFGYLGLVFVNSGAALVAPAIVARAHRLFAPLFGRLAGVPGRYAADNFARSPGRSAVPVAALTVGVAMTVCVGGFVGSFREAAEAWIDQTVPADLFITGSSKLSGVQNVPLDPSLADEMKKLPGVRDVDKVRLRPFDYDGLRVYLVAITPGIYDGHPTYLDGTVESGRTALRGGGVLVSENLSRRRNIRLGDKITLDTPLGRKERQVGGVIIDYTGDQGVIFMSTATFEEDFGDKKVDTFEVYMQEGAPVEPVRAIINERWGAKYDLFVLTNLELREEAKKLIEEWFSVTYALQAIAVLLALLGVINTLLAAVLDRTRELGLLRALGASRRQVVAAISAEAAMIGLTGGAIGVAAGSYLAVIMVFVVGTQATGWSVPFQFPAATAAQISLLSAAAAILAGIYPARKASRLDVVEALAYE